MRYELRDLPLDGSGPVYTQIYRSVRGAILGGRVPAGTKLPATRALAADLAVSRTTILAAYDQLLAEGYAEARVGAGTFVAPQIATPSPPPTAATPPPSTNESSPNISSVGHPRLGVASTELPRLSRWGKTLARRQPRRAFEAAVSDRAAVRFDFLPCVPDLERLSDDSWRRTLSRTAHAALPRTHDYADPAGSPALRQELAAYLWRARGVRCRPEQIVVVGGVAQALDLSARLFLDVGDAALLEEPHYQGARRVFGTTGAKLVGAPVDEQGANLSLVSNEDLARCKLAYVTPSHQYPTGAVMTLARRLELLAWAKANDAYIVEDDYDSEFRYAGRAIEALKSLDDADRVLYVGTFSKTLFPSLRIAYLVLPLRLVELYRCAKWLSDWASPTFEQEALAAFIHSGDFERHARRARTLYGRSRKALLDAVGTFLPNARFGDSHAGLHVRVELPGVAASAWPEIDECARSQGVGVYSTEACYFEARADLELALGFTRVPDAEIAEGIRRLAAAIESVT